MHSLTPSISEQVKKFCTQAGKNSLFVQGAGGNVSWKEDHILWIKASGTWLADAEIKDIFVPVDLAHLREMIVRKDFNVTPKTTSDTILRPSIETMLHALLPHKIVVHLHAVDILSYLVTKNAKERFDCLVGNTLNWIIVDYFKPGPDLARAVSEKIGNNSDIDIVLLKNHGLVVGGNSISEVNQIIVSLLDLIAPGLNTNTQIQIEYSKSKLIKDYICYSDDDIQQLARNSVYFDCLQTKWALYPDHIVFLGPYPYVYKSYNEFSCGLDKMQELPELIFIYREGVYVLKSFSKEKEAQLRCYYEIIRRQSDISELITLSPAQVLEITDWEAEKYRKKISIKSL